MGKMTAHIPTGTERPFHGGFNATRSEAVLTKCRLRWEWCSSGGRQAHGIENTGLCGSLVDNRYAVLGT